MAISEIALKVICPTNVLLTGILIRIKLMNIQTDFHTISIMTVTKMTQTWISMKRILMVFNNKLNTSINHKPTFRKQKGGTVPPFCFLLNIYNYR